MWNCEWKWNLNIWWGKRLELISSDLLYDVNLYVYILRTHTQRWMGNRSACAIISFFCFLLILLSFVAFVSACSAVVMAHTWALLTNFKRQYADNVWHQRIMCGCDCESYACTKILNSKTTSKQHKRDPLHRMHSHKKIFILCGYMPVDKKLFP